MSEAIAHIDQHSSGHTESIVTENYTSGRRFMSEVDSSLACLLAHQVARFHCCHVERWLMFVLYSFCLLLFLRTNVPITKHDIFL
jgi:hypothetical protein